MFPVIFLIIKRCSNTESTPSCIYFWGCFIRCSGPQWSIWSTPKRYLSLNLIRRGCKCYAFETIWNILLYFIFCKWKPIYLTYIFHCLINLLISESLHGLRIQHFPSLTKHKTIFSQLHYDVLNHCLLKSSSSFSFCSNFASIRQIFASKFRNIFTILKFLDSIQSFFWWQLMYYVFYQIRYLDVPTHNYSE